jgi:hypothetical protein
MFKAGTVAELESIELKGKVPEEAYREALRIVAMLDEMYGSDRDVDNSDGGFVLIAENIQDIGLVSQRYMTLGGNSHEAVDIVKSKEMPYINAFFLCNNEFGVNVLMPMDIAPKALLKDLS